MCPMLLMTKAVKTKSSDTMGKGVAVRTISVGGERAQSYTELMSCVLKLLGEVRDSVSGDKIISIS